jgi:hypothetical protein
MKTVTQSIALEVPRKSTPAVSAKRIINAT